MPRLYAPALVAQALELNFNPNHSDPRRAERDRERLGEFKAYSKILLDKYYQEMGPTAYAVLNAATDYATNQKDARLRNQQALWQRRSGNWLRTYAEDSQQPDFALDGYIAKYLPLFT